MIENIKDLYRFRALIWALVVRHLSIRYRGSLLGFLWSFLNPLCLMLVYLLVFRYYIRFDHVEHYTVFLFCGLLPWLWFSSGLLEGTSSLVSSGHLITKSMFPAHILPFVATLTNMVNFLLSLPVLLIVMLVSGVSLSATLLLVPLLLLVQLVFLTGVSLLFSALNVHFRDVQHILGNVLTLLFFLCPILYPLEVVPEAFRFSLVYNPIAQMTIFYQELILEGTLPAFGPVLYFVGFSLGVFVLGNMVFNRYRESFAELL